MSPFKKIIRSLHKPIIKELQDTYAKELAYQNQRFNELMILQGRALALQNADRAPLAQLHDAEFKVFSQFGEDGIIQYLIRETGITISESTFVEFGVENYSEANTRFLLQNDNWRGLIIDGSKEFMDAIRQQEIFWRHDLTALTAWIDRDNINQLIGDAGFSGNLGLLSIDIDGNDYWVWERISVVNPVIVVVEWNSIFGPNHPVSIPYAPEFQRHQAHHTGLYWGASIQAFNHLAVSKGYSLIGSNRTGCNLFFVRNDRIGRLQPARPAEAYVESHLRDSRDELGQLSFLSGKQRYTAISHLPVIEVTTGARTTLRDLDQKV
jgi:hypothetical protein